MARILLVLPILIASLYLGGCNYRVDKQPQEVDPNFIYVPQAMIDSASYKQVSGFVFSKNCLSCHDSGKVPLDSYQKVVSNVDKIYSSVFIKRTMPKAPNPPLSYDQKMILLAWIKAGAPEVAKNGTVTPVPTPIPLEPTFKSLKANVFDMKCTQCHSLGGDAARIPLVTKEDFLNSPLIIIDPQNPDESGLLVVLDPKFGSKKFMPPDKSGYTPVTDEQLKAVRDWIHNGTHD